MLRRLASYVAITAICGASAGCSTINPYLGPGTATFAGTTDDLAARTYYGRLPNSRAVAERLSESYRRAVGGSATLKNSLAIGLPLLNAGALFGATTGQSRHSNFVPAVGFGSAGALAAAGLVSAPSRADIYNNGRQALTCAVAQSEPYLVSQADYDQFLNPSAGVGLLAADVEQGLTRVEGVLATSLAPALKGYAEAAEAQAQSALSRAQPVAQELAVYRGRVEAAPGRLDRNIRDISVAVDRQIVPTEATWRQIGDSLSPTVLASTRATAPAGDAPPRIQSGVPMQLDAQAEAQALAVSAYKLARATRAAEAFLATVKAREAEFANEDCAVGLSHDMRLLSKVNPDRLERGKSINFAIFDRGGEGRRAIPTVPDPGEGVTAEVIAKGGANYAIKFTAAANAPLGPRIAIIQSGNGFEQVEVGFNVVDAAPPAVVPPALPPPPVAPAPAAAPAPAPAAPPATAPVPPVVTPPAAPLADKPLALGAAREPVLAYGVKLAKPAATWRTVIEAYASEHKLPAWTEGDPTTLNPALGVLMDNAVNLRANGTAQGGGDMSDFELWWAEKSRIPKLQQKLGAVGGQVTGVIDKATRDMIKAQNGGTANLTPAFVAAKGPW